MVNRPPTEKELEIIRDNGITAKSIAVEHSDKDYIRLLNHETRCHICLFRGDKKW